MRRVTRQIPPENPTQITWRFVRCTANNLKNPQAILSTWFRQETTRFRPQRNHRFFSLSHESRMEKVPAIPAVPRRRQFPKSAGIKQIRWTRDLKAWGQGKKQGKEVGLVTRFCPNRWNSGLALGPKASNAAWRRWEKCEEGAPVWEKC